VTLNGTITFDGERIDRVPAHEIVQRGLIHCPERRRPFREMTVLDNLLAGAYLLKEKAEIRRPGEGLSVIPGPQRPLTASLRHPLGGEQQMLAIARALMFRPRLLCIDEPSTGLAPILRGEVFAKIAEIKGLGITILLVEQEVAAVFKMATRNYVLSSGKIVAHGTGAQLLDDEIVRKSYWGFDSAIMSQRRFVILPQWSDSRWVVSIAGGHKACPYETPHNPWRRGRGHPRPGVEPTGRSG